MASGVFKPIFTSQGIDWDYYRGYLGMPRFDVEYNAPSFMFVCKYEDGVGSTDTFQFRTEQEVAQELMKIAAANIAAHRSKSEPAYQTASAQEVFSELFMENYGKLENYIWWLEAYADTYGPGIDRAERPDCLGDEPPKLLDK